ncbi:hypothetical protein PHISP_00488 [Aspergillus sp. HF37]|nr:hypothetical protein PHISP_00488 [Aspergillus sp. HF37]
MYSWLKGIFSTASLFAGPKTSQPGKEPDEGTFDELLSELATRNLFTWTFFTQGIRAEEKPLWKHEWLNFMFDDSEDEADSTECSSPVPEDEENGQKSERIQRWQGDVASCTPERSLSERTTSGLRSP